MLKLRLVRHHPCSSLVENLGLKKEEPEKSGGCLRSLVAHVGRSFVGEFANFVLQFVFRSDFTFRQSVTVQSEGREVPAAPEQVTAARMDIPGGFPHPGGNCCCPGLWGAAEGGGDLPGAGAKVAQ